MLYSYLIILIIWWEAFSQRMRTSTRKHNKLSTFNQQDQNLIDSIISSPIPPYVSLVKQFADPLQRNNKLQNYLFKIKCWKTSDIDVPPHHQSSRISKIFGSRCTGPQEQATDSTFSWNLEKFLSSRRTTHLFKKWPEIVIQWLTPSSNLSWYPAVMMV